METKTKRINIKNIISRFFGILFLTIAILNAVLIHRVPGVLYTLFSLIYFPPIQKIARKFFNFSIPFFLKILLALVILW
ncbi:TPA: hypothetical protein DIC40_00650 [Patescibacteria group bacterium]|nr:hypothetical protein [Candidatus Gracilibacteria bacterium]